MIDPFKTALDATKKQRLDLYLETGANYLRILSKPLPVKEAFVEISYEKGGKTEKAKVGRLAYKGCGYEHGATDKFMMYVLDSNDYRNEDGSLKVKTITVGKKIIAGIVAVNEMRTVKLQQPLITIPMAVDTVIIKSGSELKTDYSVDFLEEATNKIKVSKEELDTWIIGSTTIQEHVQGIIKGLQEADVKFGKAVLVERGGKKEELPTVQIDDKMEYGADEINPDDIPF